VTPKLRGIATRPHLLAPLVALQFLTIVPLRLPVLSTRALGAAVSYFPAIGALLGLAVGAIDGLLQPLLAAPVRAAFDLLVLAVLTGGLHLDGVADAADGLFASANRARRLEIMREPTVGTFGVVALVLVLLIEWNALAQVATPTRVAALVAAATLARWTMALLLCLPNARTDSIGLGFRIRWRSLELMLATATTVIVCYLVAVPVALLLILAATVAFGVGSIALSRLGGVTGDICGAAGELVFATSLVALSST
jgi:adenosylcobinamide-GDP ribazoletransferase